MHLNMQIIHIKELLQLYLFSSTLYSFFSLANHPTNEEARSSLEPAMVGAVGPCGDGKMPEKVDPPSSLPLVTKEIVITEQDSESKSQSNIDETGSHNPRKVCECRTEEPDSNTSKDSGLGLEKEIPVSELSDKDGKYYGTYDSTAMDISSESGSSHEHENVSENKEQTEENLTDRAPVTSSNDLAEHFESVTIDSPHPVETSLNQNNSETGDEQESDSGDEHSCDNDAESQQNKTGDSETVNGRKRKKNTGKKDYKKKRAKKRGKQTGKEKKTSESEKRVNKNAKPSDKNGKEDKIMPHPLMEISWEDKFGNPEQNTDSLKASEKAVKDHTEIDLTVDVQVSSDNSNTDAAGGDSDGQMVFGALSNYNTGDTTVQDFEPKGPPSTGSLFEIGHWYVNKTVDSIQDEKEVDTSQKSNVKDENKAQVKEKPATTQTQAAPGPQTRSKTQQEKLNNQQKDSSKGKVTISINI